jgi:hypothetical protein
MLIQGKPVSDAPKQYPANPKLWNMLAVQARAKFRVYPSPAAGHWLRTHYSQLGGQFVNSKKEVNPKMRDYVEEEKKKKEEKAKKKVTKKTGKNLIRGERFR